MCLSEHHTTLNNLFFSMFPVISRCSLPALSFFSFWAMMDSRCLCRFTQLELRCWAVPVWPAETSALWAMSEGWYLHSYLQNVQFILGKGKKKKPRFRIPSHSLFSAAPFQLPCQSQHPHRLSEIWTFSLSHDNGSHERTSLSSHGPQVHPYTLSSSVCVYPP